jgi:hypothetical protein
VCSAADTITGEVVDDLFYYDSVKISGVEYPSNLDSTNGSSTVELAGSGSVTIGKRGDGGALRLIVWGDTNVSSERKWEEADRKEWWEGELEAPVRGRTESTEALDFTVSGNHVGSQLVPLVTYGLGMGNETFKFSPAATLVMPVNVPDLTKIWVATKKGDTVENISEDSFCVVQDQLCVVEIDSMNEITLVREKFERCVVTDISNGSVGKVPYCQITCDKGYVFNSDMTGCVQDDDEDAIEIFETDDVDIEGATVKTTGGNGLLAGPARQGYLRFTGSNVQRTVLPTDELTGKDLRAVQQKNATYAHRTVDAKEKTDGGVMASLKKELNDVRGQLWAWENTVEPDAGVTHVALAEGEVVAEGGEIVEGGAVHASAPLLPSTGPAGIFVGVAALGFGLMAFSRRQRH